jgi:hypothetical protein
MRKGADMNKTTQTTQTAVVEVPDFKAFRKQHEAVQRQAAAVIAAKLELIKNTLTEVGEISEATGVVVSYYTIHDQIENINRDKCWSSSNC